MRAAWIALAASMVGCAALPPPAPPPFAGSPAPARSPVAEAPVVEHLDEASPAPEAASLGAAPGPARAPAAQVELGAVYKLGQARGLTRAEVTERARDNAGELGELIAAPPDPGHPLPRVVIDVVSSRGPLKASRAQATLRAKYWIHTYTCYGLVAYKDQKLSGVTRVSMRVQANGQVRGGRLEHTTLPDRDVARCLAKDLSKLKLPAARAGSQVVAKIAVYPGDEPMPPPASLLVPGDGDLDAAGIGAAIEADLPRFRACYERGLLYAPRLWGRLALRFHVTAEGVVDEVFETESRFPDPGTLHCVLRHARELRFPPPRGGELRFVVPLRLTTTS